MPYFEKYSLLIIKKTLKWQLSYSLFLFKDLKHSQNYKICQVSKPHTLTITLKKKG